MNTTVPFVPPIGIEPGDYPVIVVNTSEWSETVTITLPDYRPDSVTATPSPSINPTANPSVEPTEPYTSTQPTSPIPSNDFILFTTISLTIISAILILVVLFLVLIYKRIQKG